MDCTRKNLHCGVGRLITKVIPVFSFVHFYFKVVTSADRIFCRSGNAIRGENVIQILAGVQSLLAASVLVSFNASRRKMGKDLEIN
jgi:hypothetical protein